MILGILMALFASFSAARFLGDAVNGLLPGNVVIELTGLKVLIALEVLIPASLYASVILSFGRLYGESEFAAMFALRVTPGTLIRAVLILSACLAVMVGGLSLFVRPWANGRLHMLSGQAGTLLNVDAMEAGSFYIGHDGTQVIFITRRDGPRAPGREVFIKLRREDGIEIISAQLAYPLPRAPGDRSEVYLRDAHIYKMNRAHGQPDEVVQAQGITLSPDGLVQFERGRGGVAVAPVHATVDAAAGPAWASAEPQERAARKAEQVSRGHPDLFRLLPAFHLGAYLGPARHRCRVPGHLVGAGAVVAAGGHDLVQARARARTLMPMVRQAAHADTLESVAGWR